MNRRFIGDSEPRHQLIVDSLQEIPHIVCLCGSTKFKDAFELANREETIKGNIVLSVGTFPHADSFISPEDLLGKNVKAGLDVLHKRKIDLADEVLVLNVGGYVGSSTASEIAYAYAHDKPVRWLIKRLDSLSFQRLESAFRENGHVTLLDKDTLSRDMEVA